MNIGKLRRLVSKIVYVVKRRVLYVLNNKAIEIHEDDFENISCGLEDINYFCLSSNVIKYITDGEKISYFRECAQHSDIKTYFSKKIDEFYLIAQKDADFDNFLQDIPITVTFNEDYIDRFRKKISQLSINHRFYKKIARADIVFRTPYFTIWGDEAQRTPSCTELKKTGLYDMEEFTDILPYFAWYLRGCANNYRQNGSRFSRSEYETFYACKSIPSYIIADMLGCENLITEAHPAKVMSEGETFYGVVSPKAKGQRARDISATLTPMLQRALTSMNVLDTICHQQDHGVQNYNVVFINEEPATVCAFDNDNPSTFFPSGKTNNNTSQQSPLINRDGTINRPHLDINLAECINSIEYSEIKRRCNCYLNSLQLFMLWKRIIKVRKAIKKTSEINPGFLLKEHEWNQETLEEELSNDKYGTTYVHLFEENKCQLLSY